MTLDEALSTLTSFTSLSGSSAWILQVFVVVLSVLLLNFALRRLLSRLHRRLEATQNPWDDALVDALQRPIAVLMWILGIAFAAEIVQHHTGAVIFEAIDPIRDVGVVVNIAWFLIRLVNGVEQNIINYRTQQGHHVDRPTLDAITKLVRVSIIITATLVGMQTLGFSVSGVLAFGGIGGVAVGFAAKDLLANFFGGLIIYLDRPFAVGDWIRSPDREIEGTVETIGWRLTCIRTFDKRPVYVPNSVFSTIAVENPSRMSHRRIYETIGVRYQDADRLPSIVRKVEAMLRDHPEIDTDQTLMVNFNAFADSSLNFFVYTFTKTTVWAEYHRVKQDVLFRVYQIIRSEGGEIAFPTTTLDLPDPVQVSTGA